MWTGLRPVSESERLSRHSRRASWLKVALVLLEFWMKSVSLKPFTSQSHLSPTPLRLCIQALCAQAVGVAIYILLLFILLLLVIRFHIHQLKLHNNLTVYAHNWSLRVLVCFQTLSASCKVMLFFCTAESHQGRDQFTLESFFLFNGRKSWFIKGSKMKFKQALMLAVWT